MKTEKEAINALKKRRFYDLGEIPKNLRTERVCIAALARDFVENVAYVPDNIATNSFFNKRIKSEKKALKIVESGYAPHNKPLLRYIPEALKTMEVCKAAIRCDKQNFEYLPINLFTNNVFEELIQINGEILQYVPEAEKTKELCQQAFKNNIKTLRHFPESMVTWADCVRYVDECISISAVPKKFLSPSLLAFGFGNSLRTDRNFLDDEIPDRYKNLDLMLELIELDPEYFRDFSDRFNQSKLMNKKSLTKILSINGNCLNGIPSNLLTNDMCLTALETEYQRYLNTQTTQPCIGLLKFFPKTLIDEDVAKKAIAVSEYNLRYIPAKLKTDELIQAAIEDDRMLEEIFKYIPKAMLTESFILNAINRSIYVFKYVPDKMKTETICRAALNISTHIIDQIPRDIVIPEVLILCRKSKYPSAKILDKWMQKWVETQEVSDEYLMMALDNAPKTVKKTANWQKWARHFYKNESK